MSERQIFIDRILRVTPDSFDRLALEIYAYQFNNNPVYQRFCSLIGRTPKQVVDISLIPFLPIRFFKNQPIATNPGEPVIVFESSSTTGQVPGRAPLFDPDLYHVVSSRGFKHVTGREVGDFHWLGLLPSYIERPNASLVFMVDGFIAKGGGKFYSVDLESLKNDILVNEEMQVPSVLMGVSFGLLDFARKYRLKLHHTIVVETGGMKGRRPEITRQVLHDELMDALGVSTVWSEYGMTELTSQAWSVGGGRYTCGPTLRICTRQINDPLSMENPGERGAINCIDLANIDTCSFIATDDIGVVEENGKFQILGRLDGSEQRGCNLMIRE